LFLFSVTAELLVSHIIEEVLCIDRWPWSTTALGTNICSSMCS